MYKTFIGHDVAIMCFICVHISAKWERLYRQHCIIIITAMTGYFKTFSYRYKLFFFRPILNPNLLKNELEFKNRMGSLFEWF